jgi:hypothetical protein
MVWSVTSAFTQGFAEQSVDGALRLARVRGHKRAAAGDHRLNVSGTARRCSAAPLRQRGPSKPVATSARNPRFMASTLLVNRAETTAA